MTDLSKMTVRNLNVYYGKNHALKDVGLDVRTNKVTALIGPSGCGKSTFIRTLNRMNDIIPGVRVEGQVMLEGQDIYNGNVNVTEIRRRVGMVFQQPNPFPKSIFENVAYGLRIRGAVNRDGDLADRVERALVDAALWDEVKGRLNTSAFNLSGGQQQRLCIARALVIEPEVILFDEPCSSLDPVATLKIEELLQELKQRYTIVIVTHNMQQAARVSDWTGFFLMGEVIEYNETGEIFTRPKDKRTEDYVTGRFG